MTSTLYRMLLVLKKQQDILDGNPFNAMANGRYQTTFKAILKYWGYA